jgi:hypothetical protein
VRTDQEAAAIIQQSQDKQEIRDHVKKESRLGRFSDILKYALLIWRTAITIKKFNPITN